MSCDKFTEAIDRKRQIVEYHIECLKGLVPGVDSRIPVPIPIQAHFEGVIMSVIACADQIAAGLWQVSSLGEERGGLAKTFRQRHDQAIQESEQLQALRRLWFRAELQDIREVRRRAAHLYYDKDGSGSTTTFDSMSWIPRGSGLVVRSGTENSCPFRWSL